MYFYSNFSMESRVYGFVQNQDIYQKHTVKFLKNLKDVQQF